MCTISLLSAEIDETTPKLTDDTPYNSEQMIHPESCHARSGLSDWHLPVYSDQRILLSSQEKPMQSTYRLWDRAEPPVNQWLVIRRIRPSIEIGISRHNTLVSIIDLIKASSLHNSDTDRRILRKPRRYCEPRRSSPNNDIVKSRVCPWRAEKGTQYAAGSRRHVCE